MRTHRRIVIAGLMGLAVATVVGSYYRSSAGEKDSPPAEKKTEKKKADEPAAAAAIRKGAAGFVKAFNKGDAKAVAAFWIEDGEYDGPSGETIRGRAAVEKEYAGFFKKYPKAQLELKIDSVRLLGKHNAIQHGQVKVQLAGTSEHAETRYQAIHVLEGGKWLLASVHEWLPHPSELIGLKDLEWLIGDWQARKDGTELRTSYAWIEDRAFLRCRYTLKKDGKVVAAGMQIIGKNPAGGLKGWHFDRGGAFGEESWTRDGDHWVIEAVGTQPDGHEATAVHLLTPRGKDAFIWQSVERTVGGMEIPGTPPLKVTRVKKDS
jgi:uncharacterized protein (TIGR02246 family)